MTASLPEKLRKRIEKKQAVLKKEPFFVLVWGSGKSGGTAYKKRRAIKDHLADCLGPERVFMSEDKEFRELVARHGTLAAEGIELAAVDAVVVFDTSIGPHTELALYNGHFDGKEIVFVPAKYRNSKGMAAEVLKCLKVEYYTPTQFKDCHTIRTRANDFVHGKLFQKTRDKIAKTK